MTVIQGFLYKKVGEGEYKEVTYTVSWGQYEGTICEGEGVPVRHSEDYIREHARNLLAQGWYWGADSMYIVDPLG